MNNNKKHFIFDLDDTLTDSYEFNQQIFVDVFADYLDLSNPEVDKYLRDLHFQRKGTSMYSQFEEAVKHFSINVDPHVLTSSNESTQAKKAHKMKIFDAVEEIIKTLKKKDKKVSIISNRGRGSLNKILKNNQLNTYLDNIISCVEEGHEKPDPYCLNKIIVESGEPKEAFIYFGDSKTDYEFASSAGIDFIIIDHYLNQKKFYKMIVEAFM